jgi:hypothetical protein
VKVEARKRIGAVVMPAGGRTYIGTMSCSPPPRSRTPYTPDAMPSGIVTSKSVSQPQS